jgi:DNA helicase HerA-like ATPase
VNSTETHSVGIVLGTRDSAPLEFWVGIDEGCMLQLDDLVVVRTWRPNCPEEYRGRPEYADEHCINFYGVVDAVRKLHEGVQYDSDTKLALDGTIPVNVSYAAHVIVTRVAPEEFIPPHPGDVVFLARGAELDMALYRDRMERTVPAGVLRNGEAAHLNFAFLNGENGAHVNISGVSGVATKTSYALFLLYSLFNSGALGADRANSKAVIFNVKGEDLLFLDQENAKFREKESRTASARGLHMDRYAVCDLPATPFQAVQFLAPPRGEAGTVVPHVEQRHTGVDPFLWTIRRFALERLLPYCFADRDASLNLGFLIGQIEERLHQIANRDGAADREPYLLVDDWAPQDGAVDAGVEFNALGKGRIETFGQLVSYLEYKLLDQNDGQGDPRWVGRQNQGTLQAFVRRLRGVARHLAPLIRGDLDARAAEAYRADPMRPGKQLTVVDIHNLHSHAQMFVVGVILKQLFELKEKQGRRPYVFVVLDELNKYAPREGESPIKDVLLDIAERGRSLGIILIGAQQTASEVERRIVANASVRVVGRLDPAEAERPEYRFLPPAFRVRAGILQPGTMIVQQPEVPSPVMITFPFPAWATRKDEVAGAAAMSEAAEVAEAEDWLA